MGKFVIAKQLAGKKLITNDGEEIGKFVDAYVSEVTGKIESLIVEPNVDNPTVRKMKREEGMLLVPYSAVLAVSDHIILDKKVL
jgi:sporulation protein YlmC with PRC-barrel domain